MLQVFEGDGFDAFDEFIEAIEMVVVHFLAGQVRHAGGRGFEREHEAALELVLGAAQLFLGDGRGLQVAEFLDDALDNLDRRLARGARVYAQGAGVAIRIQVAIDGVGEPLALADVLEQARAHASPEQRIQDVGSVAAFVCHGMRGNADADLDLLERFLVAQVDA